ncbi:hypothetical protein ACVIGA_000609 [Bradyrhizobium sp. USDA 3240]
MDDAKAAWLQAEQVALNAYTAYLSLRANADAAKERYRKVLLAQERAG